MILQDVIPNSFGPKLDLKNHFQRVRLNDEINLTYFQDQIGETQFEVFKDPTFTNIIKQSEEEKKEVNNQETITAVKYIKYINETKNDLKLIKEIMPLKDGLVQWEQVSNKKALTHKANYKDVLVSRHEGIVEGKVEEYLEMLKDIEWRSKCDDNIKEGKLIRKVDDDSQIVYMRFDGKGASDRDVVVCQHSFDCQIEKNVKYFFTKSIVCEDQPEIKDVHRANIWFHGWQLRQIEPEKTELICVVCMDMGLYLPYFLKTMIANIRSKQIIFLQDLIINKKKAIQEQKDQPPVLNN